MSTVIDPRRILAEIDPAEARDLLEEFEGKNFLRVVKHEARTFKGRTQFKNILVDETREARAALPALLRIDQLRMLKGKQPMFLDVALRRSGASLVSVGLNLRTNAGIDFVAAQLGGTSVAAADWIALSNNTTAASATHASSTVPWSSAQAADAAGSGTTGEYTVLGVARKLATYNHTGGVASYTEAATWTATGTVTALIIAGLFGGAAKTAQGSGATNILFVESNFTSTSLVNTDQLTLTWTVNI